MSRRMPRDRAPVLVADGHCETAEAIVSDLRKLERVAVCVEAPDYAVEMMHIVDFAVVLVNVEEAGDWETCRRIAAAALRPVAVATEMSSPDRRYRDAAFRAGGAAYVHRPYARRKLGEMLRQVESGATGVELVEGGGFPEP